MAELDLRGRTVVVTGGRGFLGRHVCRVLRARAARVVELGSADYDLVDQAETRRMFRDVDPSVVVHLAAEVGGIGANVAQPGRFLYANTIMGMNVLESARQARVDRFVLVSTTCAYPEAAPTPLREDDLWSGPPTGATGPYGMAKRLLHEACRTYEQQYGLRSAVLVPANLYGPGDDVTESTSHVVPALVRRYLEACRTGASLVTHWGSGRPTREFLHVRDAAEGIARAVVADVDARPINLGTGVETSIRELAEMVGRATGYRGAVVWDTSRPDGQPRRCLDVTRARELLGFRAGVVLADGIAETVAWYRAVGEARVGG